jgi:TonB family protein
MTGSKFGSAIGRPGFIGAMLLATVLLAADDPATLLEKARAAHAGLDIAKALKLLRKADTLWEATAPNTPEHGAALNEMAVLMFAEDCRDGRSEAKALESWRVDAQPVTQRAVAICERSCQPDSTILALALELNADALGRIAAGAPFWERATKIRAQRVSHTAPAAAASTPAVEEPGALPAGIVARGTTAPQLIAKQEPVYSQAARLMHTNGSVLLSVLIDAHGTPGHFQLKNGLGYGLDELAAEAVAGWRFRPATKDGRPVAVQANILVNFRLL